MLAPDASTLSPVPLALRHGLALALALTALLAACTRTAPTIVFDSVPPTLAQFGARYLARGGTATQLEGTWEPKRVVILEFDSADRARAWWSSEDYRELRELRQASARTNMILVEGTCA